MSDWLQEKINDTWRWDRIKWPRGLNQNSAGEYRINEKPQYGEQRFFPQWRLRDAHCWQNWIRTTWGRCGSNEPISFSTLRQAASWLDDACQNKPRVLAHQYTPKEAA